MVVLTVATLVRADTIELQNGDRYAGKVLSLTTNLLVLQSDVLGVVNLPREKVARITLGAVTATNPALQPSPGTNQLHARESSQTNVMANLAAMLRQSGGGSNLIQQVQKQFLADAGPEANKKFEELLSGVMSGQVSLNDLRAKAKTAAEQVRSLKGEDGDDTGLLDDYLAILDGFLKETASNSSSSASTNSPAAEKDDEP